MKTNRPGRSGLLLLVALAAACGLVLLWPASGARAATFAVTTTGDEPDASPGNGVCASSPTGVCTLRAAIQEANLLPGPDTIALPSGTYLLAAGALTIASDLTIDGAGADSTFVDGGGTIGFALFGASDLRLLEVNETALEMLGERRRARDVRG